MSVSWWIVAFLPSGSVQDVGCNNHLHLQKQVTIRNTGTSQIDIDDAIFWNSVHVYIVIDFFCSEPK